MKAFLLLADGTVFEGKAVGAAGTRIGEVVFNTGMAGYTENITDPACYGQIITQTYPLAGNYGVNREDMESAKAQAFGYIVRDVCDYPNNFRCEKSFADFLKEQKVVGITEIDTRSLTRILRENGVMNGAVTTEYESREALAADTALMQKIRAFRVENAVAAVTVKEKTVINEAGTHHVAVLDFGGRRSVLANLAKRGCKLTVLPAMTSAQEVAALNPDGIMLTGGPGDPAENTAIIETVKAIAASGKPVFAYGLGHELLALARGAKTEKMFVGNRGANLPVKDLVNGRTYITSQNHGYAVVSGTEKDAGAEVRYANANDGLVTGLVYADMPGFSVQFYPELNGSQQDADEILDRFVDMMKGGC